MSWMPCCCTTPPSGNLIECASCSGSQAPEYFCVSLPADLDDYGAIGGGCCNDFQGIKVPVKFRGTFTAPQPEMLNDMCWNFSDRPTTDPETACVWQCTQACEIGGIEQVTVHVGVGQLTVSPFTWKLRVSIPDLTGTFCAFCDCTVWDLDLGTSKPNCRSFSSLNIPHGGAVGLGGICVTALSNPMLLTAAPSGTDCWCDSSTCLPHSTPNQVKVVISGSGSCTGGVCTDCNSLNGTYFLSHGTSPNPPGGFGAGTCYWYIPVSLCNNRYIEMQIYTDSVSTNLRLVGNGVPDVVLNSLSSNLSCNTWNENIDLDAASVGDCSLVDEGFNVVCGPDGTIAGGLGFILRIHFESFGGQTICP